MAEKSTSTELPLVEPASRADLHEWLLANYTTSRGAWIAVGKKGTTRTTLTYEDVVNECLCFGWIDGTARTHDDDRYLQRLTPRKPGSGWAATNKARIQALEASGLLLPPGIAAIEQAKADGSWTKLDDVEAMIVPPDLAAALAAVPAAADFFPTLSMSTRKLALTWLVQAKRAETRVARIERIVSAAAEGRSAV